MPPTFLQQALRVCHMPSCCLQHVVTYASVTADDCLAQEGKGKEDGAAARPPMLSAAAVGGGLCGGACPGGSDVRECVLRSPEENHVLPTQIMQVGRK